MRLTNILRCTASVAVIGAAAFGFAGAASAQDDRRNQDQPTNVDEIIVTAQKREQSLQDVPIVVTSLSQEVLADAGVRDIKDLQILTPGMTVTSTASEASTTARIRGVGTVGDNPGLESSVGVVIDGVYRSRNSVGFGDLGELQRIEVLKGPQGTLFGKNTSAGVINIITEAPSFTPEINGEFTVGNYGQLGASGSVSGPLNETTAFRLYAARRVRSGFYDVDLGDGPRTETDDQNQDFGTVRGQLLWLPNDNASVRIIADYSSRDEYCCVGVQVRTGPTYPFIDFASTGTGQTPPAPGFGALPFSRQAYANRATGQEIEDKGLSVEANIDMPDAFGGATFTSITAFREWETVNGLDNDFTGADIAYRVQDGDFGTSISNVSQELRLAGGNDAFEWLVGAFFTTEKIDRNDSFYFGADYAPVLSFQLSAAINAINPLVPPSPSILPCFTTPGQTAGGVGACLVSGGAVFNTGPTFAASQSLEDRYSQSSESFALFTNNTWHVTDQFDVTLGLRYTEDTKQLTGLQTNGAGQQAGVCSSTLGNSTAIGTALGTSAAGLIIARMCLPWSNPAYANRVINETHDDGEFSGTIKAAYRLNPSIMTYASYARGYKSFGFNMDRVQSSTMLNPLPITPVSSLYFPSENVDSYELGVKATLFDRTMLLNVTYFDQTFENFQLNTFLGTAFVVESIPELTTRGIDADMVWFSPVEGLSFQGGVTWTDAEYGEFTAADLAIPGNFPQLSLLPGARASFAPEYSATLSMNFDRSIGNGMRAGFSLAGKYSTEYNTGSDLMPSKMQDEMSILNGRITIGTEDDRWTLEAWAQNLTDEEYIQVAYNGFLQGSGFQSTPTVSGPYAGTFYNPALDSQTIDAFLGAPRTYGLTLRFKY